MSSTNSQQNILSSAIWDMLGRFTNYFVALGISIFLTRLLTPNEFGTFGIILAIIFFSNLFQDFGFGTAVIQAEEISQTQLSTIFYLNLCFSFLIFIVLVLAAPAIESFYQLPELNQTIFVASTIFIVTGFSLVPYSLLHKKMQFKRISIINSAASLISGLVAVSMAFYGFKIWSLIAQSLLSALITTVGYLIAAKWIPSLVFSLDSIKKLWDFGFRLFLSGVLNSFFSKLDVFVIGKLFDITTLGFYNRAQSLDTFVRNFSSSTIVSVMFPFFSQMQKDEEKLKFYYERCLHLISFIAFFISGILFLTAIDIFVILFTEKWAEAANYFRIMSLIGFAYPVSAMMVNILSARGNSKAFLRLEILKRFLLIPAYSSFFFGGIYAFLITLGGTHIAGVILNAWFTAKEVPGIHLSEQIAAIAKYAFVTFISGALSYFGAAFFDGNHFIHLFVASAIFSTFYFLLCYKFDFPGFYEIFNKVRTYISDTRNKAVSASH